MSNVPETFADVNGVRLHYRISGTGSAVVLLHGYTQTGHMWHPIVPSLARQHTVIVPDLRGAGGSAKPESGYDKKTLAADVHALTVSLGFDRVSIVGHDIGLMVAYAYAAQFSKATARVVLSTRLPFGAPLVASQDAPVLLIANLALLILFLAGATLQARYLRGSLRAMNARPTSGTPVSVPPAHR